MEFGRASSQGLAPPPGLGPTPRARPHPQVSSPLVLKASLMPVSEHVWWMTVALVPRVICIYFLFPDVLPLWGLFHGFLESDMMALGLSPGSTGGFWQVDGLVPTH